MRASYIDIRYDQITRRFRYPINMKEFLNWVLVSGAYSIEELALVGYQLPTNFILQDENLKLQDLIPFDSMFSENYERYFTQKQLLPIWTKRWS